MMSDEMRWGKLRGRGMRRWLAEGWMRVDGGQGVDDGGWR